MALEDKFTYSEETGILRNKKTGKVSGWKSGNGYLKVDYERKKLYAHRVAWYLSYGAWPEEVDHINGDRSDNRLINLRACVKQQNAYNSPKRAHSKQPYKGVRKMNSKWMARIRVNGKEISLGVFVDPREAAEAYIFAALHYHGEFARLQ